MTKMNHLKMNTGAEIPQLGFGVFQIPAAETSAAVSKALESGYRLIDTAQMYKNEEAVGAALKSSGISHDELFVTTKLANWNQGAAKTASSFDESVDKLGLDYIDLMLIHWPQPMFGEYVDTWKMLEKIQSGGRAKAIGVSNFQPDHLQRLFDETEVVPAANQIELHPGFDQAELRAFNAQHGILTEAWSPIGQGKGLLDEKAVTELADAKGKSAAQVVLRWHIQLGNVVIPKSVTPERIKQNIQVFDFELTDTEMASLTAIKGERMGPDPDKFDMR